MKKLLIFAFVLLTTLAVRADDDTSASSLICGRFVISLGDRQSDVARKCGEPTYVDTWEEERIKRDYYKDIPAETPEELSQEPLLLRDYIKVEEWTYNFGSTRFMYYLRFENGRLKRISSGGYGY